MIDNDQPQQDQQPANKDGRDFSGFSARDIKNFTPQEYSPFNQELDQAFPIGQLLTAENATTVTSPDFSGLAWVRMFNSSPAQNSEAEMMMGDLVKASLSAGQWIDIPIRADEIVDGVDKTIQQCDSEVTVGLPSYTLEFGRGGQIMQEKGMMKLVEDDDGKQYLKPLEPLISFIWERTKQYSSRRSDLQQNDTK